MVEKEDEVCEHDIPIDEDCFACQVLYEDYMSEHEW